MAKNLNPTPLYNPKGRLDMENVKRATDICLEIMRLEEL